MRSSSRRKVCAQRRKFPLSRAWSILRLTLVEVEELGTGTGMEVSTLEDVAPVGRASVLLLVACPAVVVAGSSPAAVATSPPAWAAHAQTRIPVGSLPPAAAPASRSCRCCGPWPWLGARVPNGFLPHQLLHEDALGGGLRQRDQLGLATA